MRRVKFGNVERERERERESVCVCVFLFFFGGYLSHCNGSFDEHCCAVDGLQGDVEPVEHPETSFCSDLWHTSTHNRSQFFHLLDAEYHHCQILSPRECPSPSVNSFIHAFQTGTDKTNRSFTDPRAV